MMHAHEMTDDSLPPIDRKNLLDLVPLLLALLLFSLSGATGHMLRAWNPEHTWQRRLGEILGSVSATVIVGLGVSSLPFFRERLGLLLAIAGIASWTGMAAIDVMTRRLLRYVATLPLNGNGGNK